MAQDGPSCPQNESVMVPRWLKIAPRWPRVAPRWPRATQDCSRCLQVRPKRAHDGPWTTPRQPQENPGWPEGAPRTPQDGSRWPQASPRLAQDGPKMPPSWTELAPSRPKLAQDGLRNGRGWPAGNQKVEFPKLLIFYCFSTFFEVLRLPCWPKMAPGWPQVRPG